MPNSPVKVRQQDIFIPEKSEPPLELDKEGGKSNPNR